MNARCLRLILFASFFVAPLSAHELWIPTSHSAEYACAAALNLAVIGDLQKRIEKRNTGLFGGRLTPARRNEWVAEEAALATQINGPFNAENLPQFVTAVRLKDGEVDGWRVECDAATLPTLLAGLRAHPHIRVLDMQALPAALAEAVVSDRGIGDLRGLYFGETTTDVLLALAQRVPDNGKLREIFFPVRGSNAHPLQDRDTVNDSVFKRLSQLRWVKSASVPMPLDNADLLLSSRFTKGLERLQFKLPLDAMKHSLFVPYHPKLQRLHLVLETASTNPSDTLAALRHLVFATEGHQNLFRYIDELIVEGPGTQHLPALLAESYPPPNTRNVSTRALAFVSPPHESLEATSVTRLLRTIQWDGLEELVLIGLEPRQNLQSEVVAYLTSRLRPKKLGVAILQTSGADGEPTVLVRGLDAQLHEATPDERRVILARWHALMR